MIEEGKTGAGAGFDKAAQKAHKQVLLESAKAFGIRAAAEGASAEELTTALERLDSETGMVTPAMRRAAFAAMDLGNAQKELAKINLDSIKVMSAFNRAGTAVDNVIKGFETGTTKLDLALNTFKTASTTFGGAEEGKAAIDTMMATMDAQIGKMSGGAMGLEDTKIGDEVGRAANSAKTGNDFIAQVEAGFKKKEEEGGISQGEAGRQEISDMIQGIADKTGGEGSQLSTLVKGQIGQSLGKMEFAGGKGADAKAMAGPIIEDLRKNAVDPLNAMLIGVGEAMQQHQQKIDKLTMKRIASEQKLISVQQKSIDLKIGAEKDIAKFGGGQFTPGREGELRKQQFNLTAGGASVGGLQSGSAADISRVGQNILKSFEGQEQKARVQGVAGTGGLGIDEDKRKQLTQANQLLITYTQQRIGLLKEELSIAQKKNALEKSSLEKLLEGDTEGFFKEQAGSAAAATLRAGGDTSQFSGSDLAAGLKANEGIVSSDEFTKMSSQVFSGMGLGTGAAESFAGNTPEMQDIKDKIVANSKSLMEQGDMASKLQSMTVTTDNLVINVSNDKFLQQLKAGNAPGQQQAAEKAFEARDSGDGSLIASSDASTKMIEAQKDVVSKMDAVAEKMQNTTVSLAVTEPIQVNVAGLPIEKIQDDLKPFVTKIVRHMVNTMDFTADGTPRATA